MVTTATTGKFKALREIRLPNKLNAAAEFRAFGYNPMVYNGTHCTLQEKVCDSSRAPAGHIPAPQGQGAGDMEEPVPAPSWRPGGAQCEGFKKAPV